MLNSGVISVIIPSYRQADFLEVAIDSILESPLIVTPDQIIVVDDTATERTREVACSRGVTYVPVSYHNISRSRNTGLSLAQTPYVAFLDHDDGWLPGNMEPQLAALEGHPRAAFAYGIVQGAAWDLTPLAWTFPSPPLASGVVPERLHLDYPNLGVVLFRREAVLEVGGFDPAIPYFQDADLMLHVASTREIVGVNFVGMLHRMRTPSRARSDYYWNNRDVTRWSPTRYGVGWRCIAKQRLYTRALLYRRFCEDAFGCTEIGHRTDALHCLGRAFRISPERAVRHLRTSARLFLLCLRAG
jgi:glycosyltransferase involved in cell wall biosynthesis